MSFKLNTIRNTSSAIQASINENNYSYSKSFERLSTGLRINSASDDASSMMIANDLRYKSKVAEQAIKNINDNIGIFRIADVAMGTQVNTLIQAKEKAVYLANDPVHSKESKQSLEDEIKKFVKASDLVSTNTYYNGKSLLNGYDGSVPSGLGRNTNVHIKSTNSNDIGHVSIKITDEVLSAGEAQLAFQVDNEEYYIHDVEIGTSANTGIGRLAEVINQRSDTLKLKATYDVHIDGSDVVKEGTIDNMKINGVVIGTLDVKDYDKDGTLVKSINNQTLQTGVEANMDIEGKLVLRSIDGRGIKVEHGTNGATNLNLSKMETYGKLKMTALMSDEIILRDKNNFMTTQIDNANKRVFTLKDALSIDDKESTDPTDRYTSYYGTRAQILMSSLDSAVSDINKIRMESVASGEEQLQHSISFLQSYSMNSKNSESMLRDADFAEESFNFNKRSILINAGQFAFAQNNQRYNRILYNLV